MKNKISHIPKHEQAKRVENYDAQQSIFGAFLGAWKCDEMLFLVLDILHQTVILT